MYVGLSKNTAAQNEIFSSKKLEILKSLNHLLGFLRDFRISSFLDEKISFCAAVFLDKPTYIHNKP
jgi:hypothetical protein